MNKAKKSAASTTAVAPVYIRCDAEGWIPALQVKVHKKAKQAVVMSLGSAKLKKKGTHGDPQQQQQITIDLTEYADHVLPLQNVDDTGARLVEYSDMVDLPYLHEVREMARFHLLCV
jgi:hypothetical protein